MPVISKIIEEEQAKLNFQQQPQHNRHHHQQEQNELKDTPQTNDNDDEGDFSDNEIAPENYFFTT